MKIKYSVDEKTGTTYAYATGLGECADGVNYLVAWELVDNGYLKRSDVFYTKNVAQGFASTSHVKGKDEYDAEIGRCVARDKVLAKYYRFQAKALSAYKKALHEYLDGKVEGCLHFATVKQGNAEGRLETY